MSRNFDTIIALLRDRVVLINGTTGAAQSLALSGAAFTSGVTALLKEARLRRGSRVVVLGYDFFTQSVRLPELQTAGLAADELRTLLSYEVEPFSSLSAERGETAYQAGAVEAGYRSWQVVQVEKGVAAALQQAVRSAGGRLVGLAALESSWQAQGDAELAASLPALVAGGGLPLVVPQVRKFVSGSQELYAVALFVVAAGLCFGHYLYAKGELARRQGELQEVRREAAINSRLAAANKGLRERIEREGRARKERVVAAERMQRFSSAWGVLLQGLTQSGSEAVVIRGIKSRKIFEAEINGTCATGGEPGDYLVLLGSAIESAGWQINSVQIGTPVAPGSDERRNFAFKVTLEFSGFERPAASWVYDEEQLW